MNFDGKNVDVEYRDSDKSVFMKCTLNSTNCKKVKKIKKQKEDIIDETKSKNNIWQFTYTPGTFENKQRTYEIKNTKDGYIYTKVEQTPYWDLVAEQITIGAFSPDNSYFFYLSDRDGFMSIYEINLNQIDTTLTGIKLNIPVNEITTFTLDTSGNLFIIGNEKENPYNWQLYKYNIQNKTYEKILDYVKPDEQIKDKNGYIIINEMTNTGYSPVFYNEKNKKIIHLKNKLFSTKTFKKDSTREILKIQQSTGVLLKPKKQKINNVVIWLHGGPYRQTSLRFHNFLSYGVYDNILEKLRENGLYVLKLDYKGSLGQGRAYSESIKYNIGKEDVNDVINAIKYMKDKYDVKNVYLAGNSYGGYLSLKTIAEHSEQINGVVSIAGVTDWKELIEGLPSTIFKTQFDGMPNENNKIYYDQANIKNKINNIKDNTITIIHGTNDRTIPVSQAQNFYEYLKTNNKKESLVLYKGEDHVILKQKNIKNLCEQIFTSFGLKNKKTTCSK